MESACTYAFMDLVSVYKSKPLNLNPGSKSSMTSCFCYGQSSDHVLNFRNLKRTDKYYLLLVLFPFGVNFMVT